VRRALPLLCAVLLAGCSSGLCVEVDAVPAGTQAGTTPQGPLEHIGSFTVNTRSPTPSLGLVTAGQTMADAAFLATRIASTPASLLASAQAVVGATETAFRNEVTTQVLRQQAQMEDQKQALVDLAKRLTADTDPANGNAVSLATQNVLAAYLVRRPRLLLASLLTPVPTEGTPTTTPTSTTTSTSTSTTTPTTSATTTPPATSTTTTEPPPQVQSTSTAASVGPFSGAPQGVARVLPPPRVSSPSGQPARQSASLTVPPVRQAAALTVPPVHEPALASKGLPPPLVR
jgi:hypothetical protein